MWAHAPLSGEGAKKHGGRFNRPGTAALYTSLDITTAWMEAQQGFPFKSQPMTLVAYRVDCGGIADLTDPGILAMLNCTPEMLACAWEQLAWRKLSPPTWTLADRLQALGFAGIKVRSFAPGCADGNHNLVFWRWGDGESRTVQVVDDFGRLPKTPDSWRQ